MKSTIKIFYGLAITYVVISLVTIYTTYQAMATSASEYGVSVWSEWGSVLQTLISATGGFLGFACVLYGIAVILKTMEVHAKNVNELFGKSKKNK